MPKTVTIEVPDDLAQQLGAPADAVEAPLQKLIVNTLSTLAELVRSLKNDDAIVRIDAAKKLGELGIEAAIPALANLLTDDNSHVRSTGIDALRNIGTEEALSIVSRMQPAAEDLSAPVPSLFSLASTLQLGTTDLGENHDYYIAEELERELQGD